MNRQTIRSPNSNIKNLDISTREILDYHNSVKKSMRQRETNSRIQELSKFQLDQEEKYLQSLFPCVAPQLENLRDLSPKISATKVSQLLSEQFYNPEILRSLLCWSESLFYLQPYLPGSIESNVRVRNYLRNLKRIGAESAEGFAFTSDLFSGNQTANQLFIVKAPQDPKNPELIHELFVGLLLNRLRSKVPNFAYVFGGFQCSPPIVNNSKQVVTWCNNRKSRVNYILYENIKPAISFRQYIQKCTPFQWLDKYLQVLYSLAAANQEIDFTHYDLHDENVLIRTIDSSEFLIPYLTETGKYEMIKTEAVATIIDYGFSYVKYNGNDYGKWGFFAYSVLPTQKFPLHDAYKLLLMSMRSMKDSGRMDLFDLAAKILKFFNSQDSADQIVDQQENTYYFLPYVDRVHSLTIYDLTRYIREVLDTSSFLLSDNSTTGQRILGCNGTDFCLTGEEFLVRIGATRPLEVETVFEFYDLVSRLESEKRTFDIDQILMNLDYEKIRDQGLEQYDTRVIEGNSYLTNFNLVKIFMVPLNELFNPQTLKMYSEYVWKVAKVYDIYQELILYSEALQYMAGYFSDVSLEQDLSEELSGIINSYSAILEPVKDNLKLDLDHLEELRVKNSLNPEDLSKYSSEKDYNKYSWYWTQLPNILLMFS